MALIRVIDQTRMLDQDLIPFATESRRSFRI